MTLSNLKAVATIAQLFLLFCDETMEVRLKFPLEETYITLHSSSGERLLPTPESSSLFSNVPSQTYGVLEIDVIKSDDNNRNASK